VIEVSKLLKIRGPAVVYHLHSAERRTRRACRRANLFLAAEQRNARYLLACADGSGNDCARVVAFGKDYVLRVCGGALA
jgi:hypothetical protein